MELRPYEKHDIDYINRWLVKRLLPSIKESEMPENGVIAFENDRPVAAAFLRKCEGPFAIMDSLITDPDAPGQVRNDAIDSMVQALVALGEDLCLKAIICSTSNESVIARAKRHGFTESTLIHMIKPLGDK